MIGWQVNFVYGGPWGRVGGSLAHDLACLLTISDPQVREDLIEMRIKAGDADSVAQQQPGG